MADLTEPEKKAIINLVHRIYSSRKIKLKEINETCEKYNPDNYEKQIKWYKKLIFEIENYKEDGVTSLESKLTKEICGDKVEIQPDYFSYLRAEPDAKVDPIDEYLDRAKECLESARENYKMNKDSKTETRTETDQDKGKTQSKQDKDNVGFINKDYTEFKLAKDEKPIEVDDHLARAYKHFIPKLQSNDFEGDPDNFTARQAREIIESIDEDEDITDIHYKAGSFTDYFYSNLKEDFRSVFKRLFSKKGGQTYGVNKDCLP